ncbi:hypothetical protein NE237_021768 [Protea cynaroides]|uniref:Uncharacterized protein n=1 Tax=Protea cynaroides TaxID=273540 RepID=A0A9Q0H947_9MAGN|nr:hypothetical protein NE237_021768 [Protea cynaroides]
MKENVEQTHKESSFNSGLEEAAVTVEDNIPRGSADGRLEGPPIQSRLEEEWTPIRVKKKRSGGPHGGGKPSLNPTHILTHQSSSLPKDQSLELVASSGKLNTIDSKFKNPSQNDSFLFGATNPKPAAEAETVLCPLNRFGCLYSDEEQNVLAGPTGPPAVSDLQVTPG